MSDYLPADVRDGLRKAQAAGQRRKSRLRLRAGDAEVPIIALKENGFAVSTEHAAALRGLVDVFDGARHLSRCLVVASTEEEGITTFEYKRNTLPTDHPATDYEVSEDRPNGLLPRR